MSLFTGKSYNTLSYKTGRLETGKIRRIKEFKTFANCSPVCQRRIIIGNWEQIKMERNIQYCTYFWYFFLEKNSLCCTQLNNLFSWKCVCFDGSWGGPRQWGRAEWRRAGPKLQLWPCVDIPGSRTISTECIVYWLTWFIVCLLFLASGEQNL